jgi:hypothetical protein
MLVSLAAPGPAAAQSAAPGALPPIEPGKMVRARLTTASTVTGRFTSVTAGRLGIDTDTGRSEAIPIEQIRELAVRGRHTKAGAIIGGIAGAGFGAFVAIVANALCEGGDNCSGFRPWAIAVPAFGAGGALVGAAVGSAFPKWKRVYP